MRRFLLLSIVASIFAIGCQNDNTTDNPIGGGSTLTISLPQTRTALGEKVGDTYPVYWSEGDKIAVNGKQSDEAQINIENRTSAIFNFSTAELSYPYNITYPYCTSTTAEQAVVEFPAEQEYTEGTFAAGSAPMCGYAANRSSNITLNHLAGVLRIPIKPQIEGVVLEKVVFTSTNSVAGEFTVDCQNAAITATERVGNVVTYTLPANFALSTTTESTIHIALPAVEVGACTIEFFDNNGKKMVAKWNPSKPLSQGIVREFKCVEYKEQSVITLQALETEEDSFKIYYEKVYGYVKYTDGNPIAGVAVSDGFQVTTTNSEGYYELDGVTPQTWYIYCSIPSDVVIPINELGRPDFYQKYPANSPRYDFTFEKLPGGPEEDFYIIAIADPQPKEQSIIDRFSAQSAPEIKSYTRELGLPCYGVILGDVVNSRPHMMEPMRTALEYDKLGIPTFTIMGNHDHGTLSQDNPLLPDERNSNYQIKIQREFEECFGPVNYSFNRGDVHIVCMRDILYTTNNAGGKYKYGFTDEQLAWLEADLKSVSTDKTVVLCVHIPMQERDTSDDEETEGEEAFVRVDKIWELLYRYDEAHILSGHTHRNEPCIHESEGGKKIYEHTISAIRQDKAESNILRDGSPCGYKVLKVQNGWDIYDWYYKGVAYGMNNREDQMRLCLGGTIFGKEPDATPIDEEYPTGFYQIPGGNKMLFANIFSSDPTWSVKVSTDGGSTWNDMDHYYEEGNRNFSWNTVTSDGGDGTYANPIALCTHFPVYSYKYLPDFWVFGLNYGYLGDYVRKSYNKCMTMWTYTSASSIDPDKVIVRATDSHSGKVYECNKVEKGAVYNSTTGKYEVDFGYAVYNPAYNPPIE